MNYTLEIELISDATFGRGDGVAGLIDTEIEYDARTGLPYLRGRTLRGLLVEECANLLFALARQQRLSQAIEEAAASLFGSPGSSENAGGALSVGAATFPDDVVAAIRLEIEDKSLTPAQVLDLLTGVRRQTAVDYEREAPRDNSLRSQRFLLRETSLFASLEFAETPSDMQEALLTAAALSIRRGGTGRNRGRGKLKTTLRDANGVIPSIEPIFHAEEAGA